MSVNSLSDTKSQFFVSHFSSCPDLSSPYRDTPRFGCAHSAFTADSLQTESSNFFSCSWSSHSSSATNPPGVQFARPTPPVTLGSAGGSSSPPVPSPKGSLEEDRLLSAGIGVFDVSTLKTSGPLTINQLSFNFKEGATGTFQIQLTQAPISDVVLTFTGGNFLVVDADGNPHTGTQSSIWITPETWQQPRKVWFIAEDDNVGTDRTSGNTIGYVLSGGLTFNGVYDLGTIANTYTPDPTRFNIDLDFRNDFSGFWTTARQAIAQQAADVWANWIANRWQGFTLNNSIQLLDNGLSSQLAFMTKRYIDDVLVFVNAINSGGAVGGYGGPEYEFGGWATPDGTGSMPRVGQIAIDTSISDTYLYNAVLHELGHVLGLVGMNWAGYLQQDLSAPQTATFKGYYSTLFNGGSPIPLQSQDGPNILTRTYNYYHPASQVYSAMSYGWLYSVAAPTVIDYVMLADSGYHIYGINA